VKEVVKQSWRSKENRSMGMACWINEQKEDGESDQIIKDQLQSFKLD
jgi:hypothetical protein